MTREKLHEDFEKKYKNLPSWYWNDDSATRKYALKMANLCCIMDNCNHKIFEYYKNKLK